MAAWNKILEEQLGCTTETNNQAQEKLRYRLHIQMREMKNRWKHLGIRENNQAGVTRGEEQMTNERRELLFKIKQEIMRQKMKP